MIYEMEVIATAAVQRHLDRNPRVIEYRGDEVYIVKYDSAKPISRYLGVEARELGLHELGGWPYNA